MKGTATERTTIMLPVDLRRRTLRRAEEQGVSFGAVVRDSLEATLPACGRNRADDPLFADAAVWRDRVVRAAKRRPEE